MEAEFLLDTSPTDLDEDSETSYASGNTLGKLWAFINQVCDPFSVSGQQCWSTSGSTVPTSFCILLQVLCWRRFALSQAYQIHPYVLVLNVWLTQARILVEASKLSILWHSLLLMNNQGITKFIRLADDSMQVPKLQKKMYKDYKFMSSEWTNLDLLRQVLMVWPLSCPLTLSVAELVNAAPHP